MENDIDMICKKKKETGSSAELPSILPELPVAGPVGKNTVRLFTFLISMVMYYLIYVNSKII